MLASPLVHLLPFVEQGALYDTITTNQWLGRHSTDTTKPAFDWNNYSPAEPIKSAKINYFVCPSGNKGDNANGGTPFTSSYIGVAGAAAAITTTATTPETPHVLAHAQNGAIKIGKVSTMALKDGTSNTIVYGEISRLDAHIGIRFWFGGASLNATRSAGAKVISANTGDLKILNSHISASDKNPWKGANGNIAGLAGSWGSNHPGLVVFGLGDGSVRGISDSTSDDVMFKLAHSSDGNAVALP
jgi:hypothetical protein